MSYALILASFAFKAFLREFLNHFVIVYIDILLFSPSEKDHIHHVWQVLQHLLENQLFIKLE